MDARSFIPSALKQPRVKPLVGALPNVQQRRDLSHIVKRECRAATQDSFQKRREAVLDFLAFDRADYI
jgi:hypothetical protein